MIKLIVLSVLIIFLFGCKASEADFDEKLVILNDIPQQEAEAKSTTPEQRQSDIVSTTGPVPFIKDVNCEPRGLLEFILVNPHSVTFALRELPKFEADALGYLATRITLNGRQFSELPSICNMDTLGKGDEITCRIAFDPNNRRERYQVRTRTDILLPNPKNFLRFIAPGYGYEVIFTCD